MSPPGLNMKGVGLKIRVALPRGEDPALLEVWLPRAEDSERRLRSALNALPARTTSTFVVHTDRRTVAHAKLRGEDGSPLSQHRVAQLLSTLREQLGVATEGSLADCRFCRGAAGPRSTVG